MSKITRLPRQYKWRHRQIRHDDDVAAFIDKNSRELIRFEEQWLGIEWLLARLPDKSAGREVDSTMFLEYAVQGKMHKITREIQIRCTYDIDEVRIHSVKFGDEKD